MVLAVEHADGTSSCAKLADNKGWRFYNGLGGDEGQVEKTRLRRTEMQTAVKVLRALHRGESSGLKLSTGDDPATFLAGALDLRCLAAVGHSYGGATTALLVAEDPLFRCGICLDPWWAALPPEAVCMQGWRTKSPLLVLGSHDWNTPNMQGDIICGPERQEAVLDAVRVKKESRGQRNGAGGMLLVISGSSHNTYADPLPLFAEHVGWALRMLGLTARLDPVLGVHLVNAAVLNFLSLHMPLTGDQRQLQTWAPSSGATALEKIAELDRADAVRGGGGGNGGGGGGGLLSWMFPGRGLLNAISDSLLNSVLRKSREADAEKMKNNGSVNENSKRGDDNETESDDDDGDDVPDDVVTGEEVLEAVMPTTDAHLHMHAPSAPITTTTTTTNGSSSSGDVNGGDGGGVTRLDARQRQALRSQVGSSYADTVREEHIDQVVALLGEDHVWKCKVFS